MIVKWLLLLGGMSALLVLGCNGSLKDRSRATDVIVEGGEELPDEATGQWKADQYGWEFVLAPDGRILSAIVSFGRVRVVPGQTTTLPTKSGGEAVFVPGTWAVQYIPSTKELTLKITMDRVRVEMAGNIVEGSSTDVFVGPIDPAGGVWQAQWTTFSQYAAHTPDTTTFDLSTDTTYGETKLLTFRKMTGQ